MVNIELYINNRLTDVGNNFNVRLNRQLINPNELNTKDAQYSYSINLPPTNKNHSIFNYSNIEETKDKFNREYSAELVINSVRVFLGKFRLSEISRSSYKGNLYTPSPKSIKDIFGELKLNEIGTLRLDFTPYANTWEALSKINEKGKGDVIFPLTLYGLLPKVPDLSSNYTGRTVLDSSVRLGLEDLPPSISPMTVLKQAFHSKGYKLTGNAYNDTRLTSIRMSYKNPDNYPQPWNWGDLSTIHIKGNYQSIRNLGNKPNHIYERDINNNIGNLGEFYSVDLFNCNNVQFQTIEDSGTNTLYKETQTDPNDARYIRKSLQITVPRSGVYKIRMYSNLTLHWGGENESHTDPKTGTRWVTTRTERDSKYNNYFEKKRYEIQVIRDFNEGDLGLSNKSIAGTWYNPNFSQNNNFNTDSSANFPKWFPQPFAPMIIDPSKDRRLISGLHFGRTDEDHPYPDSKDNCYNTLFIKNGYSWDVSYESKKIHSGYNNQKQYLYYNVDGNGNRYTEYRNKYKSHIVNIPNSYIRLLSAPGTGYVQGDGGVNSVIYLEKGEILSMCVVSEAGDLRTESSSVRRAIGPVIIQNLDFELWIEPFKTSTDWIQINDQGEGTGQMNWNEPTDFEKGGVNLVKFLPSEIKVDDFIDNFCKAFNLKLTQLDTTTFSLEVKQSKKAVSNQFINIDNLASVWDRSNTSLGLPSLYKIGFTIDEEEEGYVSTNDDGGGEYNTGAIEEKIVDQKSFFSYNWFKTIYANNVPVDLPIISKHEVWTDGLTYPEAMVKRYTNQALRFWYPNGLLPTPIKFGKHFVKALMVSNILKGQNTLNYKNKKLTILDNYFTLLIEGSSHYTEVEGYLTPIQYENLNGNKTVMFNGDLYYIAEISGYDPSGRNKTKLKLIRKI